MYNVLLQYLSGHKRLDLPGIGTLVLQRIPASFDYGNRMLLPPANTLSLQHGTTNTSPGFITWLSQILHVSEREASQHFEDFTQSFRSRLMSGEKIEWPGVGRFSKGLAGEISFQSSIKFQPAGEAVPAIKIARAHAEHIVRVGEEEHTNTEMREILEAVPEAKSYTGLVAIILLILSLIFVGYYLSVHGVTTSAAGNQQIITPSVAPETKIEIR